MNLLLSERERKTMTLLGCYRYLSRSQIEQFVLADSEATKQSREVISRRIIMRLRAAGLVSASTRLVGGPGGGSTRVAYFLLPRGIQVAQDLYGGARPPRRTSRGTFLLQHALATADVALAFQGAAQANPGHEVLQWECDWQAAHRLGSSLVAPDAHFVYATPEYELDAFVEVDLGTEGSLFFSRKIARYLDLYRDGSWRGRIPGWPVVLTVTPNAGRAELLRRATEALLDAQGDAEQLRAQTEFAFAALPDLLSRGPLARLWRVAGRSGEHALLPGILQGGDKVDYNG